MTAESSNIKVCVFEEAGASDFSHAVRTGLF